MPAVVLTAGILVSWLVLGLLSGCSSDTSITPPKPAATADRDAVAQQLVESLRHAITSGDAGEAAGLAIPDARTRLAAVVHNAQRIGLRVDRLRYLEQADLSSDDVETMPAGTWGATVELGWTLPGWDPRESRVETTLLLTGAAEPRIAGFTTAGDGRIPLWLDGPLQVSRSDRALVLSDARQADLSAARLVRLGRLATTQVSDTLPWQGRLVVEVPATERQLEQAVAAGTGAYSGIAAVTTTTDGSAGRGAPLHVFLNPDVFSRLGGEGAQVVMTHETTHVATQANASRAPLWVKEGFADYVALSHAPVPLREAAGQAIARTRKQGPPRHLPTDGELATGAPGLGTTYELAWLACRYIALHYGQGRLIAFYHATDRGTPLAQAERTVLGTDERTLVAGWSRSVTALAR